jgi:HK97 gp10 family phage protein
MVSVSKYLTIAQQVSRINKQLNNVVDLTTKPIEETLLTQASLLASEQRSLAAEDPNAEKPGALKASIRVERGAPTSKKAIVIKIKAGGEKTAGTGEKSAKPYDYARANEFGTQKMKAQPFFFPVYRARKKEIRAAVRKAISLAVKGVFK